MACVFTQNYFWDRVQEIKDATNSGVMIVFNFKDVIIVFM